MQLIKNAGNWKEKTLIIGNHLEKYKKIYIALMIVIAIFELILFARGLIVFKSFSRRHILYLTSYILLFTASALCSTFLIISRRHHFKPLTYYLISTVFSIAMIIWSMLVSYLDMEMKNTPIVYLTVIVTIAGVVVIDPVIFITSIFISSLVLIGLDAKEGFNYFISAGEYINYYILLIMSAIINVRLYFVSAKEYKSKEVLEFSILEERNRVSTISLQTIMSISNAVDAKDKYTREHSQRVAEYSEMIAKSLNWSRARIKNLYEIALLHDIGKIGVKDSILNSPNKLSSEEFDLMKQHTVIGGDILKDLTILENVDLGAKYHHERYDGTGYPSGLAGKDIPIEARIITIADAFDAMNSDRVYRDKLSKEDILKELIDGKGKQFDPELLDLFLPYAKKILNYK